MTDLSFQPQKVEKDCLFELSPKQHLSELTQSELNKTSVTRMTDLSFQPQKVEKDCLFELSPKQHLSELTQSELNYLRNSKKKYQVKTGPRTPAPFLNHMTLSAKIHSTLKHDSMSSELHFLQLNLHTQESLFYQ